MGMLKRVCICVCAALALAGRAEAQGSVTVAWDPNPETDLASYEVRYGTAPGVHTLSVSVPASSTSCTITGLSEGVRYYFVVHAVNDAGLRSGPSNEVNYVVPYAAAASTASEAARIMLGLERFSIGGGWMNVKAGTPLSVGTRKWLRLDWGAYNNTGGETHAAVGDVDGDGLDEIVIGLSRGGQGWIGIYDDDAHGYATLGWVQVQWPSYNAANGTVYPAVGDIDGDGRAEIIAGLGAGGDGRFEVFGDASTGFAHRAWGRLQWEAYNVGNGEIHPAVGDLNGDGRSEIVLGLANGGGGWLQVFDWNASALRPLRWIRGTWAAYNSRGGVTWPAVGDLDGNGQAEIVLGLGNGSAGWLEILGDDSRSNQSVKWLQTPWSTFNTVNGETRPAIGDIDGDAGNELVVALGFWAGNGGRLLLFDGADAAYASLGTKLIGWETYELTGGGLFPAVGKLR
jgi:hypothetical protein